MTTQGCSGNSQYLSMQAGKISQQMHMVFLWLAGYMLWCLVDGVERQPFSRAHGAADGSVSDGSSLATG